MPQARKKTYQYIWVDGKKMTVISAKIKKGNAGLLVIRTDVFGQLYEIKVGAEYTVRLSDEECYRAELTSIGKDPRIERWEFKLSE